MNLRRCWYSFESTGIPQHLVLSEAQTPKCFCASFFFFFLLNDAKPREVFPQGFADHFNCRRSCESTHRLYSPITWLLFDLIIYLFFFLKQLGRRDSTSLTKLLRSSTRTFTRTSMAHCSPTALVHPADVCIPEFSGDLPRGEAKGHSY